MQPQGSVAAFGDAFHLQYRRTAPIGESGEPSVFPEKKTGSPRREPEASGRGKINGVDFTVSYCAVGSLFHRLEAHSIEPEDPGRGSEPQVSVGGLLNINDRSEAVFRSPHGVMEMGRFGRRAPGSWHRGREDEERRQETFGLL